MINKSVHSLQPGNVLFDMHYASRVAQVGLRIAEPHRVQCSTTIKTSLGSTVIEEAVRSLTGDCYMYINKLLVVTSFPECDDNGKTIVTAAWSYDGCRFGLMKIEVDA